MRFLPAAIILGLALIISFWIAGASYKYKTRTTETIVVTGLAEKDFVSDLIVWNGSYSRKSLDLKSAYASLKQDENVIRQYLKRKGVADAEMVFSAVEIIKEFNNRYDGNGNNLGQEFTGYNLFQRVRVESKDVDKLEKISREVTELIESNIEFNSQPPLYYYSGLSDIKIDLLSKASEDGKERAQSIAKSSGSSLGNLKKATMGIFQITGKNSNEDYSYGGTFNTRDKAKTGSITIRMEFLVD